MVQMLSSSRHWRRELSVPPAQLATTATPSPAPLRLLANHGHSEAPIFLWHLGPRPLLRLQSATFAANSGQSLPSLSLLRLRPESATFVFTADSSWSLPSSLVAPLSGRGPSKAWELGACLLRHQAFQKPPWSWRLLKGLVHQRTGTQLHREKRKPPLISLDPLPCILNQMGSPILSLPKTLKNFLMILQKATLSREMQCFYTVHWISRKHQNYQ
ncbi:hypothetical protein QTO34_018462 [Cnephaeus nilssonii]|uniref:Uncharacterized protein n=1 Tax=Cnephaeus nilssonii TaxID=3371016 RepID=A0AA40LQ75_CNENI|nr:hypothetical protein QTO34_018462 [Eptesicus nilssonii]